MLTAASSLVSACRSFVVARSRRDGRRARGCARSGCGAHRRGGCRSGCGAVRQRRERVSWLTRLGRLPGDPRVSDHPPSFPAGVRPGRPRLCFTRPSGNCQPYTVLNRTQQAVSVRVSAADRGTGTSSTCTPVHGRTQMSHGDGDPGDLAGALDAYETAPAIMLACEGDDMVLASANEAAREVLRRPVRVRQAAARDRTGGRPAHHGADGRHGRHGVRDRQVGHQTGPPGAGAGQPTSRRSRSSGT